MFVCLFASLKNWNWEIDPNDILLDVKKVKKIPWWFLKDRNRERKIEKRKKLEGWRERWGEKERKKETNKQKKQANKQTNHDIHVKRVDM